MPLFDDVPDVSILGDAEFLQRLKLRNQRDLAKGQELGWWDAFDDKGPIKIFTVKKSDFASGQTMAHVIVEAIKKPFSPIFESVGEARRNGWGKPINVGTHALNKGRIQIVVE